MGKANSKLRERKEKKSRRNSDPGDGTQKPSPRGSPRRGSRREDGSEASSPRREESLYELNPADLKYDAEKWGRIFADPELDGLKKCYCLIAGPEGLSKASFDDALGMKPSLYTDRIFQIFDSKGDGQITFTDFLQSMSILTAKGSDQAKLKLSYQILDVSKRGITKRSLEEILVACLRDYGEFVGSVNLDTDQIQDIVERTFFEGDSNADGVIDYNEYQELLKTTGGYNAISEFLTIDIPGVISKLDRSLTSGRVLRES